MNKKEASLHVRLRHSTASHHKRLESRLGLLGRPISRLDYLDILSGMYGLYVPLEKALAEIDWSRTGIDFSERRRRHLIEADLRDLGMEQRSIDALPRCGFIPKIESIPEGVGVLYVMEGSTLGGPFVLQHIVAPLGVTAELGGHFFSSQGRDVKLMWRQFLDVLEQFNEPPGTASAVEDAAVKTFEAFYDWFSDARQHSGGG